MIVSKYGLILRRLRLEDIELVRQKRNSEAIRNVMQFREEITPEMQLHWFNNINNFENYYYIVEYQGKKIGLINDKHMDWEARTSESGLFFWDTDYINTFIPILASLVLLDVGFYYLDWRVSYIHVRHDNPSAVAYIKQIGYTISEGQENEENQLYFLSRENFETKGKSIRKAAQAFRDDAYPQGFMMLEPADFDSGLAQQVEEYFDKAGIRLNIKETEAGKIFYRLV
jgi:UDP-4-amino-4,6-dideoxy-N-acetyl-beta-L-altrosamine N-acetyltransferase